MESVDILIRVDCLDNLLVVDMLRQGKLDDETVVFGVFILLFFGR